MIIRQASAIDRNAVIGMLERYKQASPLAFHKNTSMSQAHQIFSQVIAGAGVCFVAQDSKDIIGFLLAIKTPNCWDLSVFGLQELAYWVNPERRGSTAGYRLIKTYADYAKDLKAKGDIQYYTISKMCTSPDLDYGRFGFRLLESTWEQ